MGLDFPVITIADMVRAQKLLIDHLGIEKLFCVIGGSMGGMQVLQWAASYPESVFAALPIATAARHSAQNIAFHEVGRQADHGRSRTGAAAITSSRAGSPHRGLAVARMAAHITYLSEAALHRKFGRNLQDRKAVTYGFDADFQVESYLRHQGSPSSTASTPTPISTSPAPWTISIWRRSMAACWPTPSATRNDAVLPDLVHQRLAVPDAGVAGRGACAQRGRRQCQLRRDRDRQGPRRLPARRAGIRRDSCAASSTAAPSTAG